MELLPLELSEDLALVEDLLHQFHDKTGSLVAADLLKDWPAQASKFVKVMCCLMYFIRFELSAYFTTFAFITFLFKK